MSTKQSTSNRIINRLVSLLAIVFLCFLLSSCGGQVSPPSPPPSTVDVNELSSTTNTVAEPIYINNCGNSSASEQVSQHSQTVSIEGAGELGASAGVVEASVSAKYVTSKGVTKSQKVVASPGTNMKFVLLWTEQVNEGSITVQGGSDQATYRVTVPISVQQASAEDLGCGDSTPPTGSSSPVPPATPTTQVVVATESPLGNAIIGALNNDGTAAIDTSDIGLHPKRHLDAAGTMRATYEDHIWVIPESGTGIATFNDLEPGEYVVCFGQYGSWVRVGEISIKPYETLRVNFKWPPSYNIGSTCKLD